MIRYLSEANPKKLRGTALLRLDFNTEGDWRMERSLPTIKFLLRSGSKIVIVSHRGRPKGFDKSLSLRNNASKLKKLLGKKIIFVPNLDFLKIKKLVVGAPSRSIFLLENIRFLKGESTKKPELAKKLAGLADFYVNDAFAVSHHGGDSVSRTDRFLPSYAGLELEEEINFLSRVLRRAKRPLVVVLGGAKAHDKLGVLKYFKNKADNFLLGGAAGNTLLHLRGIATGKSLRDRDPKDLRALRQTAAYKNIVLPVDSVVKNGAFLDIGPKTVKIFEEKIASAKTIIWSGPLGFIEKKPFDRGTLAVARAIAKNKKAFSVTGGGETVMFLKKHKLDVKFDFVSTGGGAMLDFLAGKKLPGIEAIKDYA